MEDEKRTKDLQEEEILKFNRFELEKWMSRVMARLYKLIDKSEYHRLSSHYVAMCSRGIEHAKRGLVALVNVIKANWPKLEPQTHLSVVK